MAGCGDDNSRINSETALTLRDDWAEAQLVGAVLGLMQRSAVHREWSVADLGRLLLPPVLLRQCLVFCRGVEVAGFFTWANLTEEAEVGYLARTRRLQPEDWNAGDHSRIWIVDGLAPFGGLPEMARAIRREMTAKAEREGWSARRAQWARSFGTGAVQRIGDVHGSFVDAG